MKTLAVFADRLPLDAPGRPTSVASSARRCAENPAGVAPIVLAAEYAHTWSDTQPGYHVQRFPEPAPADTP